MVKGRFTKKNGDVMVKGRFTKKSGENIYFMGLSKMNISLLEAGYPIKFDGSSLGLTGSVLLMYGETEMQIIKKIETALENSDKEREDDGN